MSITQVSFPLHITRAAGKTFTYVKLGVGMADKELLVAEEALKAKSRDFLINEIVKASHNKDRASVTLSELPEEKSSVKKLSRLLMLTRMNAALFLGIHDPVEQNFIYSYGASVFANYPCEVFSFDPLVNNVVLDIVLEQFRESKGHALEAVTFCMTKACQAGNIPVSMYLCLKCSRAEKQTYRNVVAPQLALASRTPVFAVISCENKLHLLRQLRLLHKEIDFPPKLPPSLHDHIQEQRKTCVFDEKCAREAVTFERKSQPITSKHSSTRGEAPSKKSLTSEARKKSSPLRQRRSSPLTQSDRSAGKLREGGI